MSLKILFLVWVFDLSRSTDWVDRPVSGQAGRPTQSTEVLAAARIRVHVCRSTGPVDRTLSVCKTLALCLFGSTGRSTVSL